MSQVDAPPHLMNHPLVSPAAPAPITPVGDSGRAPIRRPGIGLRVLGGILLIGATGLLSCQSIFVF